MPLDQAKNNQPLLVVAIEGGHQIHHRLKSLGIRPGVLIEKISGRAGSGPVVVRHGRSQTAIGHGVAHHILVEISK
ncbi:MAG TPA: FeoA family protein [Candidatus Hydrogenedentes bacterium]|nr:FeoA family protein [Candidatus Hydrogenedentota bacterium]HOV74675.1 FeoA family protein [Candidatus Hydrogenedentota bacterium]HPC15539.1 FeoA family protein [Candidatus Hydrogenedentota bacterium]